VSPLFAISRPATATYADLQSRALDELQRSDLAGAPIQNAINDAIKHFQRRAHFVTESTYGPLALVTGQDVYPLPPDFSRALQFNLSAHGIISPLRVVSIQEIDEMDANATDPTRSIPECVALYGSDFKVYPRPDSNAYTLTVRYLNRYATPQSDDDEGFWVNEAETPIRLWAQGVLWRDYMLDRERATENFAAAEAEWVELVAEYEARVFAPGIRPWA